jgi:hypothetical protein
MDIFWSREPVVEDRATVHALVIGVSRYEYLQGGTGPETDKALLAGLGQLSAAATAATRIANWLRDNFEYPNVQLGSIRLLASPSPSELPLPGGANPPPATSDEVKKALTRWRRDARSTPGNITLLLWPGTGSRQVTRAASCCCRMSVIPIPSRWIGPSMWRRSGWGC